MINNTNSASPVFNNCVSINAKFMVNAHSFPEINNCTIVNTYAEPNSNDASSIMEMIANSDSSVVHANNTIFWANKLSPGYKDIADDTTSPSKGKSYSLLANCITQVYGKDGLNGNRVGVIPGLLISKTFPDPITRCSQQMMAFGSLPALPQSMPVIIIILPLYPPIFSGSHASPVQSLIWVRTNFRLPAAPQVRIFVDNKASGNKDGSSWQNAYTDLQKAFCNSCADTIRIATGVYKPAQGNRDSSFYIDRPLTILGGYPTGGGNDSDRKPIENPTTLSGNIGNQIDSMDNTRTIVLIEGVRDSVVIDGLIIRDATMDKHSIILNDEFGAGIFSVYNHLIVRNCEFIKNTGSFYGAGLSLGQLSYGEVYNCIFSSNSTEVAAGALYSLGDSLFVNKCVFENNFTYSHGGAFARDEGLKKAADIEQCLF